MQALGLRDEDYKSYCYKYYFEVSTSKHFSEYFIR